MNPNDPQERSKPSGLFKAACLGALFLGCGSPDGDNAVIRAELESDMDDALQIVESSVDFSLCVEDTDGASYSYDRGVSTMRTSYESASTSKLVTAVVILRLVEKGYLDLADHPQDRIPEPVIWAIPETDPLYGITLANLLSFTSGLTRNPANGDSYANLAIQVRAIADANIDNGKTPGTEFYYHSNHLQLAGYMALRARREAPDGADFETWNDLFGEFKAETGLFPDSAFDLPALYPDNPRLAGGMHWTGDEYMAFLRALVRGEILGQEMMEQLLADHTPSPAVTMAYSPPLAPINPDPSGAGGLGEDWHYGFGLWQECRSAVYDGTAGSRVSCPGAFGAYPFWDRARGYFGIVARQGEGGTFPEGVTIERAVDDTLGQWSALD